MTGHPGGILNLRETAQTASTVTWRWEEEILAEDHELAPRFASTLAGFIRVVPEHTEVPENFTLRPALAGTAAGALAVAPEFIRATIRVRPEFAGALTGTLAATVSHMEVPEGIGLAPRFAGAISGVLDAEARTREPVDYPLAPAYAGRIRPSRLIILRLQFMVRPRAFISLRPAFEALLRGTLAVEPPEKASFLPLPWIRDLQQPELRSDETRWTPTNPDTDDDFADPVPLDLVLERDRATALDLGQIRFGFFDFGDGFPVRFVELYLDPVDHQFIDAVETGDNIEVVLIHLSDDGERTEIWSTDGIGRPVGSGTTSRYNWGQPLNNDYWTEARRLAGTGKWQFRLESAIKNYEIAPEFAGAVTGNLRFLQLPPRMAGTVAGTLAVEPAFEPLLIDYPLSLRMFGAIFGDIAIPILRPEFNATLTGALRVRRPTHTEVIEAFRIEPELAGTVAGALEIDFQFTEIAEIIPILPRMTGGVTGRLRVRTPNITEVPEAIIMAPAFAGTVAGALAVTLAINEVAERIPLAPSMLGAIFGDLAIPILRPEFAGTLTGALAVEPVHDEIPENFTLRPRFRQARLTGTLAVGLVLAETPEGIRLNPAFAGALTGTLAVDTPAHTEVPENIDILPAMVGSIFGDMVLPLLPPRFAGALTGALAVEPVITEVPQTIFINARFRGARLRQAALAVTLQHTEVPERIPVLPAFVSSASGTLAVATPAHTEVRENIVIRPSFGPVRIRGRGGARRGLAVTLQITELPEGINLLPRFLGRLVGDLVLPLLPPRMAGALTGTLAVALQHTELPEGITFQPAFAGTVTGALAVAPSHTEVPENIGLSPDMTGAIFGDLVIPILRPEFAGAVTGALAVAPVHTEIPEAFRIDPDMTGAVTGTLAVDTPAHTEVPETIPIAPRMLGAVFGDLAIPILRPEFAGAVTGTLAVALTHTEVPENINIRVRLRGGRIRQAALSVTLILTETPEGIRLSPALAGTVAGALAVDPPIHTEVAETIPIGVGMVGAVTGDMVLPLLPPRFAGAISGALRVRTPQHTEVPEGFALAPAFAGAVTGALAVGTPTLTEVIERLALRPVFAGTVAGALAVTPSHTEVPENIGLSPDMTGAIFGDLVIPILRPAFAGAVTGALAVALTHTEVPEAFRIDPDMTGAVTGTLAVTPSHTEVPERISLAPSMLGAIFGDLVLPLLPPRMAGALTGTLAVDTPAHTEIPERLTLRPEMAGTVTGTLAVTPGVIEIPEGILLSPAFAGTVAGNLFLSTIRPKMAGVITGALAVEPVHTEVPEGIRIRPRFRQARIRRAALSVTLIHTEVAETFDLSPSMLGSIFGDLVIPILRPAFAGTLTGALAVEPAITETPETVFIRPAFVGAVTGALAVTPSHAEVPERIPILPELTGGLTGALAVTVVHTERAEGFTLAAAYTGAISGVLAVALEHTEIPEGIGLPPRMLGAVFGDLVIPILRPAFAGAVTGALAVEPVHTEIPEGFGIRPVFSGTIAGTLAALPVRRRVAANRIVMPLMFGTLTGVMEVEPVMTVGLGLPWIRPVSRSLSRNAATFSATADPTPAPKGILRTPETVTDLHSVVAGRHDFGDGFPIRYVNIRLAPNTARFVEAVETEIALSIVHIADNGTETVLYEVDRLQNYSPQPASTYSINEADDDYWTGLRQAFTGGRFEFRMELGGEDRPLAPEFAGTVIGRNALAIATPLIVSRPPFNLNIRPRMFGSIFSELTVDTPDLSILYEQTIALLPEWYTELNIPGSLQLQEWRPPADAPVQIVRGLRPEIFPQPNRRVKRYFDSLEIAVLPPQPTVATLRFSTIPSGTSTTFGDDLTSRFETEGGAELTVEEHVIEMPMADEVGKDEPYIFQSVSGALETLLDDTIGGGPSSLGGTLFLTDQFSVEIVGLGFQGTVQGAGMKFPLLPARFEGEASGAMAVTLEHIEIPEDIPIAAALAGIVSGAMGIALEHTEVPEDFLLERQFDGTIMGDLQVGDLELGTGYAIFPRFGLGIMAGAGFEVALARKDGIPMAPVFAGTAAGALVVEPDKVRLPKNRAVEPALAGTVAGNLFLPTIRPKMAGTITGTLAATPVHVEVPEDIPIAPEFAGTLTGTLAATPVHTEVPEIIQLRPRFEGVGSTVFSIPILFPEFNGTLSGGLDAAVRALDAFDPRFRFSPDVVLLKGVPVSLDVPRVYAEERGSSYTVEGLPDGLSYNATRHTIEGTPTDNTTDYQIVVTYNPPAVT